MGNIIFLILVLISFVGLYKIFEKAGLPAWKALIPVYIITDLDSDECVFIIFINVLLGRILVFRLRL
jgi:hypothetical protein